MLVELSKLSRRDLPLAGSKCCSLGELASLGLRIPRGFVLPVEAYRRHLADANVLVGSASFSAPAAAERIRATPLGAQTREELGAAFDQLGGGITVRSSVHPVEDDPRHSCAGLFVSRLNLVDQAQLEDAVRECFASLFSEATLAYFARHSIALGDCQMALCVQETVPAEAAATVFSRDPDSGDCDIMLLEAVHGFGAGNNDAEVDSDRYFVADAPLSLVAKRKGLKLDRFVQNEQGGLVLTPNTSIGFALSDEQVLEIAAAVQRCRAHRQTPVDVEVAIDQKGEPVYLQLRAQQLPQTTASTYRVKGAAGSEPVVSGAPLVRGAATGPLTRLSPYETPSGVVLAESVSVTDVPKLVAARGVVVHQLPPTSHPAIHLREIGIPTLVVGEAFQQVAALLGRDVTLDCSRERGALYDAELELELRGTETHGADSCPVPVCLVASYPSSQLAAIVRHVELDGVHVRGESVLYDDVRMHPLALVDYDRRHLSGKTRALVERKVAGYPTAREFYISKFADRLCHLATLVGPSQTVTLRLTDLLVADYAELVGGDEYERLEANPVLGLRGAARFVHPRYRPQLEMELLAVKRAVDAVGPGRLKLLVPMVRSVRELEEIRHEMSRLELQVELGAMVETVAAVFSAAQLAEVADFFVVGTTDLAQVINSADREHPDLHEYANPTNSTSLQALELLSRSLSGRSTRVYVPASHFGHLRRHLETSAIGVFSWADRYSDDLGVIQRAAETSDVAI